MTVGEVPSESRVLNIGIVGLGMATLFTLPALILDKRMRIVGAVDTDEETRKRFSADFGVPCFCTVEELCSLPELDGVYIATPNQYHMENTLTVLNSGRHVLVEKPLSLDVESCLTIDAAAKTAGLHVVVGHTHAFDAPARLMASIIQSGEFGRLYMINTWNFTDFLYRPRRPDELDTARGGGIVYNQVPHQVDVVRLLAGGLARSVRSSVWALDAGRPTEGSHASFIQFEGDVAATVVYSGFDYFDTDELHDWVGENGELRQLGTQGVRRRQLGKLSALDEANLKAQRRYGVAEVPTPTLRRQPHGGILVASCEKGDLRWSPDGVVVYGSAGIEEHRLPLAAAYPDREGVLDSFYRACASNEPPVHDAAWAAATMEVCIAILKSSREGREIQLQHQVSSILTDR